MKDVGMCKEQVVIQQELALSALYVCNCSMGLLTFGEASEKSHVNDLRTIKCITQEQIQKAQPVPSFREEYGLFSERYKK